jgi:hypothetical protein
MSGTNEHQSKREKSMNKKEQQEERAEEKGGK